MRNAPIPQTGRWLASEWSFRFPWEDWVYYWSREHTHWTLEKGNDYLFYGASGIGVDQRVATVPPAMDAQPLPLPVIYQN